MAEGGASQSFRLYPPQEKMDKFDFKFVKFGFKSS